MHLQRRLRFESVLTNGQVGAAELFNLATMGSFIVIEHHDHTTAIDSSMEISCVLPLTERQHRKLDDEMGQILPLTGGPC